VQNTPSVLHTLFIFSSYPAAFLDPIKFRGILSFPFLFLLCLLSPFPLTLAARYSGWIPKDLYLTHGTILLLKERLWLLFPLLKPFYMCVTFYLRRAIHACFCICLNYYRSSLKSTDLEPRNREYEATFIYLVGYILSLGANEAA